MLVIRGNNVFPSTIEGIVREFEDVAEFVIRLGGTRPSTELAIVVEPRLEASSNGLAERIATAIQDRLHFRAPVSLAVPGTLPRSELKSRRVIPSSPGGTTG